MPQLTPTHTFTYNGVNLGAYSEFKARIETVYDRYERIPICLHYVIEAVVTLTTYDDATDTDAPMINSVAAMLLTAGGELEIDNLGLGDIHVNGSGQYKDVRMGPKVTMGAWEPLGAEKACRVPITIETWIVPCAGGFDSLRLMSYGFEITYQIQDGLTTRNITGYLELPMTHTTANGTTPQTSVDAYREQFNAIIPPGFKRTTQSYRVSGDRRTLEFTLVDTEIDSDNPYPEGAIEVEARQTIQNDIDTSFANWRGNISVRARGARNHKRADILNALTVAVEGRLKEIYKGSKPLSGQVSSFILRRVRYSEEWYTREFGYDITYTYVMKWEDVISKSGFWQPLDGADWPAWRASMDAAGVNHQRGYSRFAFNSASDTVISPCNGASVQYYNDNVDKPSIAAEGEGKLFGIPKPDPDESWLSYNAIVSYGRQESTLRHKLSYDPGPRLIAAGNWTDINNTDDPVIGRATAVDDVIQTVSGPGYDVWLTGDATRVGYPVPRPDLIRVGGMDMHKNGREVFISKKVGNTPHGDVWGAAWAIPYKTTNAVLGPLPIPPNHHLHVPQSGF